MNSTAQEILRQLGGSRFTAMTGANTFMSCGSAISFRLPGARGFCRHGVNTVTITLNAADTYDMVFSRRRAGTIKEIETAFNVYGTELRSTFTRVTGLDTSL